MNYGSRDEVVHCDTSEVNGPGVYVVMVILTIL